MRQQQHARQRQGPEGIDVFQRIEADAAELLCGVVAEPPGDEAVGGLVKGDGDEERDHPDRKIIQREIQKRRLGFKRCAAG